MRTRNRFEKGSGVFKCEQCTRSTRATGGDNDAVKLCEECYEMAGIENEMMDSDKRDDPTLRAEYDALKKRCIEKGGRFDDNDLGSIAPCSSQL